MDVQSAPRDTIDAVQQSATKSGGPGNLSIPMHQVLLSN
jgi:hypothetical protein